MDKKSQDKKNTDSKESGVKIPLNSKKFKEIFQNLAQTQNCKANREGITAFWLQNKIESKHTPSQVLKKNVQKFHTPNTQNPNEYFTKSEKNNSTHSNTQKKDTNQELPIDIDKVQQFRKAFNPSSPAILGTYSRHLKNTHLMNQKHSKDTKYKINIQESSLQKSERTFSIKDNPRNTLRDFNSPIQNTCRDESLNPKNDLSDSFEKNTTFCQKNDIHLSEDLRTKIQDVNSESQNLVDDKTECNICCDFYNQEDFVVYECGHTICFVCACRLIHLFKDSSCPTCLEKTAPKLDKDKTSNLIKIACLSCSKDFKNKAQLASHHAIVHKRVCCEVCVESKKCFPSEWTFYESKYLLDKHQKGGLYLENIAGFFGHYRCSFCRSYFYDYKEFISHMRNFHAICTICERAGLRHVYYKNKDLPIHLTQDHYSCGFEGCEGIAFLYPTELYEHNLKNHRIIGTEIAPFMKPKDSKLEALDVLAFEDKLKRNASTKINLVNKVLFYKKQLQNLKGSEEIYHQAPNNAQKSFETIQNKIFSIKKQEKIIENSYGNKSVHSNSQRKSDDLYTSFDKLAINNLNSDNSSKEDNIILSHDLQAFKSDIDSMDRLNIPEVYDIVRNYESNKSLKKLFEIHHAQIDNHRDSLNTQASYSRSGSPKNLKSNKSFEKDEIINLPMKDKFIDFPCKKDSSKVLVVKVPRKNPKDYESQVLFMDKKLITDNVSSYLVRNSIDSPSNEFGYIKACIRNAFPKHYTEVLDLFISFSKKEIRVEELFVNLGIVLDNQNVIKFMKKILSVLDSENQTLIKEYLPKYIEETNFPKIYAD